MTHRPGETVDEQFELIAHLGGGAFGEVFRARNLADDREYALKFLAPSADIARVRREYGTLRQISHPNVVEAHWAGKTTDGEWYVATALVEGETLGSLIRREAPLQVDFVHRLGVELLAALRAVHPDEERIAELERLREGGEVSLDEHYELEDLKAEGLVHRDIKPDNVMIDELGSLVLVDFGISSRAGDERGTVSATPEYLPPDLPAIAIGSWDPDMDRYAAGMVIYECLCGERDRAWDPLVSVDPLSHQPTLPAELVAFLVRACSPERADRFTTTREMSDAWLGLSVTPEPSADDGPGVRFSKEDLERAGFSVEGRFEPWPVRDIPVSNDLTEAEIEEVLIEIVEAEGPILCGRLYDLFYQASGERPTSLLNRLTYGLVRSGQLEQIEAPGGGQQDKTVVVPGAVHLVCRPLGERSPWELPGCEIDAWAGLMRFHRPDDADDDLPGKVTNILLLRKVDAEPLDADAAALYYRVSGYLAQA